ncbi:MAG: alcohol dehydrogenase catalytic domain-containing protein [Candidatus Lokiarchaeota archaeon]|nr:alcohol dehydrogenase catalytic domain-containing protein [Candidatus Lokiarchaeota archaeon]
MKLVKYYNNKDVRLDEDLKPQIYSKEMLVKVKKSGICGSDVLEHYRLAKMKKLGVPYLVLGHEIAGDIVEVGKDITGFKVGDKVFVSHHVPCFECHYCRQGHQTACDLLHNTNFDPGGFAEYVRVPAINIEKRGVFVLGNNITYDEGVFIEPLGCVVRAQKLVNVSKGQTVLILGSGVSGLLHLQLAKVRGAAKVITTDVSEYRLEMAKKLGADTTLYANTDLPSIIKDVNENRLPDVIIVCTGAFSAAKQALECAGPGSKIVFFAVPGPGTTIELPINDYWRNEVTVMTSYGAAPDDLDMAYNWLLAKRINVLDLITHRLPFSKAQEAFDLVCKAGNSLKVVLEPDQPSEE